MPQLPRLPRWSADDLKALPPSSAEGSPPCDCHQHASAGWESAAAPLAVPAFECVATLQDPEASDEPTLAEWHPTGTSYWSPQAPMAVDWFPCNRCTVWRCTRCQRCFLQYTEFGGYYVDHRLRPVDPSLVV